MAKASATITVYKQIDIESVTWYYKLQASTASPPAKPTAATPSGWSTTEPSYTEGSTNSLYICQKTTFSDGSFEYSDVSLSSAYEASKAAYNKSVQAKESIDGLEVGGRNILLNSATNYPSAYSSATLTVEKNVAVTEFNCTDGIRCYGKGGTNKICMRINKNTHGLSTATDISVAQQQYVFSIYIKNNHETNVFYVAANLPGTGKTAIQPSEAKRLVFYCTGNGTNIIQFNLSTNEIGDDYDITFWHPQIELGNKVTDWSPAPEDVENGITSAQATADAALLQSVEYIIGTQTAVTGSWTGKSTGMSALRDGAQIRYWLPHAGSGNATLNLTLSNGTTTGAIPVYRQGGSVNSSNAVVANRVTTHFPPGSVVPMTYGVNRPISVVSNGTSYTGLFTGWFVDGAYDSGNTYNRVRMQNVITASTAITAGRIICGTASGYKNIGANIEFDLSYPILYAVSAIAAAGTGDNNYLSLNGVSATSNGTIESGTAKKTLYLKGTVTGNTFKISASPFMTTATPSSSNGFYYIPLGIMYSTTAIYFQSSNRLYAYLDGAFQPVDTAAVLRAQAAKEIAEATDQYFWTDNNGAHVTITPKETDASGATGFNSLWNSLGLLLRYGSNALAKFGQNSVDFYDGSGNNASNVIAKFGSSGMRIGKEDQTNIQISSDEAIMNGPDGNPAMVMQFSEMHADDGTIAYGVAITDENEKSYISITPSSDDDYLTFNDLLEYRAEMDGYSWVTGDSGLAGMFLGGQSFQIRYVNQGAPALSIDQNGNIDVYAGRPVIYEQQTVTVTYTAGTVGTRGANVALGSTSKTGYTFVGAFILDHPNADKFSAVISRTDSAQRAYLSAYRATTAAVSGATVKVRMVWVNNKIIGAAE